MSAQSQPVREMAMMMTMTTMMMMMTMSPLRKKSHLNVLIFHLIYQQFGAVGVLKNFSGLIGLKRALMVLCIVPKINEQVGLCSLCHYT